MLRLAFLALNIWSTKKGFDLFKENTELKQKLKDSEATVRTLARQVPEEEKEDQFPPLPRRTIID